jgi:hypothetical protein
MSYLLHLPCDGGSKARNMQNNHAVGQWMILIKQGSTIRWVSSGQAASRYPFG